MEVELDNEVRKMRIINYLDYMDDKASTRNNCSFI